MPRFVRPQTDPPREQAPVELCVVHPGALAASSWSRLVSHLPPGTPVTMLELEAINPYWADEPALTLDALTERLRDALERGPRPARPRVLVGWGFGGVVADAVAARLTEPPRHVVALEALAPGVLAGEPDDALLLRAFALYLGARRGRALRFDPARLHDGVEPALAHLLQAATRARALREDVSAATVAGLYRAHAQRMRRDHRLTAEHTCPRARRSAGTGSGLSRCWPAAATTTRC
jgi:thioesterase domain-containing protein